MTEVPEPRTLLEALIRQRQLTWDEAARLVQQAAKAHEERSISLTGRHLARLARRERETNPNPSTSRALQHAFGHSIVDLLAPSPFAGELVVIAPHTQMTAASAADREVLAVAADRAQRFTLNLPGMADLTMDQVVEGVRDLALAYPTRPLPELLSHLVSAQDTVFGLLERPQRPSHGRQLYFLAGVVCGMLAKASHDLGDSTAALTQSRTAFLCADQADHDGLRSWICGLQGLISYWASRPQESIRYVQRGAEFASRARNTANVWLPVSEARAWARLGNVDQTLDAIRRAETAWDSVQRDELDELGGLATFSRARQLYYAADALAWLPSQATAAERYSALAIEAYADSTDPDWAFGDQAGSYSDLALARLYTGEIEGAAEAIAPVLALPVERRIGGIIKSVQRVQAELLRSPHADDSLDLQEEIEAFTRTPVQASPR